jgi:hypothetical protein
VNDPDGTTWLRQKIKERLYLAQHTIELGNAAHWTELSSGVLMTIEPDAPQDRWDGVHPLGDSSLTRLMEANDPQDTIARCEAELAILDEHYILYRGDTNEAYAEFSVCYPPGIPGLNCGCVTCHYIGQGGVHEYGICRTVKFLASSYQHWGGYREEDWRPGVTPWKAPSGHPR